MKARLTDTGENDPFLKSFPSVFDAGEWHNDMPGLKEGAEILAESDGCPRQIVRYEMRGIFPMEFGKRRKMVLETVEVVILET